MSRVLFRGAIIALLGFSLALAGCSVRYSFTGASISPDVKSVTISPFPNVAPLVNPTLSSTLTEALKERFSSQTSLALQDFGGHLQFEGEITGYSVAPTAIQGDETAALNRLTVVVQVRFRNLKDPSADFDRSFTAYEEFDSNLQITQVESSLVPEIVKRLVEDIFNASVARW